MELSVDH